MLVLALHNVQEPSAKVPFCMMALLDAVKNKQTPPELRCRQVFPTNGTKSSSLWDAPSTESLREWLDEFLSADCTSDVFEVQEQFAVGLPDLARARAAERVTANTRATAAAVQERTQKAAADAQQRIGEIDARLKVSEHASAAYKTARETSQAAAKRTAEMFGKVGQQAQTSYSKALENDRVAGVATVINSNVAAGWRTISSGLGGFMKGSGSTPPDTPNHPQTTASAASGPTQTAPKPSPAAPAATSAPTVPQNGGSLFTLDDLEADAPSAKH